MLSNSWWASAALKNLSRQCSMDVPLTSSMIISPSLSMVKPSPPLPWNEVVATVYYFSSSSGLFSTVTSCTRGVLVWSKENLRPDTSRKLPAKPGYWLTPYSRASLILQPGSLRTIIWESMMLETLEQVILPGGMTMSLRTMPALMKAKSVSQQRLMRSAKKLPQLVSRVRMEVNRVSSSTSLCPTTSSYCAYSSISSSTYFSSTGSTLSAIGTFCTSHSKLKFTPARPVACAFGKSWTSPMWLKLVPLFITGTPSTIFQKTTWSCPPSTMSTPRTFSGKISSAQLRMWVRATTMLHFSSSLSCTTSLLATSQQSWYSMMPSQSSLRMPTQSSPAIPIMPTRCAPTSFTTYGLPSPITRPVAKYLMLASSQGKLQALASLSVCSSSKSNSWLPQQAQSRPIMLSASTICQPSLMLVRVEGERASPENSTSAPGWSALSWSSLALKLHTPIDLPLGCRSQTSLKWIMVRAGLESSVLGSIFITMQQYTQSLGQCSGSVALLEQGFTLTEPLGQGLTCKHAHYLVVLQRHQAVAGCLSRASLDPLPAVLQQFVGVAPGGSPVDAEPVVSDVGLVTPGVDHLPEQRVLQSQGSEYGDRGGSGMVRVHRQTRAVIPGLLQFQFPGEEVHVGDECFVVSLLGGLLLVSLYDLSHAFGQRHRGIVATGQHQPVQQVIHCDNVSSLQLSSCSWCL